jgi:uncharacterized SAM-binding protein YcdF (DUF218 family)
MTPLGWLLASLFVGAAWFAFGKRWRRRVLVGCIALAALAAFAMTPLFANALLGSLEGAFRSPPSCDSDLPRTAVVLAGGVSGDAANIDDLSVLELATRRRLDRAVEWWHEDRSRRLVMSGGTWSYSGIPDSRLMQRYAERMGVEAGAIRREERSLRTWESAQRLAELHPALPRRIVLVTSASHMPRAAYAMRQAGFDVCPIEADQRRVPLRFPGALLPQHGALEKTADGLHEVVGLAYYRWLALRDGA